ncbi:unnamed protein product, partial [Symbiodinium pilosum]
SSKGSCTSPLPLTPQGCSCAAMGPPPSWCLQASKMRGASASMRGALHSSALQVQPRGSGRSGAVDPVTAALSSFMFRLAVSTCGPFRSETLHQVNLSEVPVQQDGQECASLAAGMELRPSTSRLLGVLLLGVLPQTGLGAWLLLRKRVAGAFVNLFTGLYATVLLIHLLMQGRLVNLLFFLQASSLTYAASTCLAVAANRAAWSVPSSVRSFSAALGSWASHAACLSISAAFALALPEPWAAVAATVLLAVLAPLDPVAARLAAVSFLVLISQVEASASDPGLPESLESIFPSRLLFYLLGTLVLLAEEAYASFEASPKETEMAEEPMLEPEEDQRQTWMLLQAMPLQQLLVLQRTHLQNSGNASYKAGEGEEEC